MDSYKRCCYAVTIEEFQQVTEAIWLMHMRKRFVELYAGYPLSDEQINAWVDCFRVMQKILGHAEQPKYSYIVFEYMLPYEGGRRPDVLLINASTVLVLEFKMVVNYQQAYRDQVVAYVNIVQTIDKIGLMLFCIAHISIM